MNAQLKPSPDVYMQKHVIRPAYIEGVLCGFAIHAWNRHAQRYEAVGHVFSQYKTAVLALQALEGNVQQRRIEGIRNSIVGGIISWLIGIGVAVLLIGLLGGCSSVRVEHEHVSHPFAGPPFGPLTEEDSLDTVNVIARKEHGRFYIEAGLGYKVNDGGFHGPDLTFTSRVGVELWRK